ncbi:hypothetical protein [Candidatus Cardinium sp. cBcalN1]|nr:hypothetical protein [Candidatus Cardinium sp. cBcalN1]
MNTFIGLIIIPCGIASLSLSRRRKRRRRRRRRRKLKQIFLK